MKRIRRLRKGWKIFGAAMLIVFLFSGYMIYAQAESSIVMNLSSNSVSVRQGESSTSLYVSQLTGNDDNHVDADNPSNTGKPVAANIEWTTSKPEIVNFLSSITSGGHAEKVNGLNTTLYGAHAGQSTIKATYYTKTYDVHGAITSSTPLFESVSTATVPLSATVTDSYSNSPDSTVYKMGDQIHIETNTCAANKLFISTTYDKTGNVSNDGVVKLINANASSATLEIVGGGKTTVTVRTQDGDGVNALSYNFDVKSEIKFTENTPNEAGHKILSKDGQKYIVVDQEDYVPFAKETLPSNVAHPDKTGVVYRTTKEKFCTFEAGKIQPIYAGITKVTAGLLALDTENNETWYTIDDVDVVVPFKKLGNTASNMNVGDKLQLQTSAEPSSLTWSTDDNNIAQVDPKTGVVTAVGAGTTTINVIRKQDELYTTYGLPFKLQYQITVIDGFGLSTTSTSVNIGSSFDLEALVTDETHIDTIQFKVEKLPLADGSMPTGDVVSTKQTGKVLTVKGESSGSVKITASQTINGVVKYESCVVYVTTPVGDVYIDPASVAIDRGSSKTVALRFDPDGPTNNKVLWSSSNPEVATVEGNSYKAEIKGVSGGSATITVITEDGLKVASCEVSVREPVTGITLDATTVESTMAVGSYQLKATVLPEGPGVNQKVTWTSTDPSVCTVSDTGLVTYKKPGTAAIVCQTDDNAFIAYCNFIISIPVEEIKLDYSDEIMSIGKRLRITAEVLPITASNRAVSWESSNKSVCVVDSNGLVEAVGTGTATILCKSLDGGYTAMCNIYVKQPVTSVVLNTNDITVRKGQTFWLNATCLPENADNKIIKWESRDEDVCKVEDDGKVTATGAGTTSIIATNVDTGLTAFCVVTVTQPVTGITLNSDYQQLWVGAKYAIIPTIEPYDAENKNVTYLSSDTSVATVDDNGVVTALKGGSCIIEVTTEECKLVAACTIDVKEYVSGISLSETNKFMNIGASGTLSATVSTGTATNKAIIWSSSNNDICYVDGNGNLIAYNPGRAVITATAADGSGVSASCIVQVVNPVTSLWVEPDTVRLLVGDSQKVTANIEPSDATIKDVTWTSSNESIATVDESGEIFALSTGKCKITATSNDGNSIKGVCWVYVTPVINISSLKINSSDIYMLSGKSRQLSVRVRPSINTDSYEWYSTDTGVVVVDGDGVITTVGPGTADVVVESNNAAVSSQCTIHSLAISQSSMRLEQYDSNYLDVIGTTDKITWRSSNPRVCTVTSDGRVVGRKAGTATVTAVVNNKTLSCVVRVTNIW